MAKEAIGSNATFTGPQQGLTVIGDYAYAYSGVLGIDTTETTMLEFTTGSEIIVAEFNFTVTERTGDQLFGNIYMNGLKLATSWSGLSTNNGEPSYPIKLIIPPLTTIKVTGDNITAATREFAVTMIGKVYE